MENQQCHWHDMGWSENRVLLNTLLYRYIYCIICIYIYICIILYNYIYILGVSPIFRHTHIVQLWLFLKCPQFGCLCLWCLTALSTCIESSECPDRFARQKPWAFQLARSSSKLIAIKGRSVYTTGTLIQLLGETMQNDETMPFRTQFQLVP